MRMNQGEVGRLPGSLRSFVQVSLDKIPNIQLALAVM